MKKTQPQSSSSFHQKSDSLSNIDRDQSLSKTQVSKNLSIAPLNLTSISNNSLNYSQQQLESSNPKPRPSATVQSNSSQDVQYNRLSNSVKEMFIEMRKRTLSEVFNMKHSVVNYHLEPKCNSIVEKKCSIR